MEKLINKWKLNKGMLAKKMDMPLGTFCNKLSSKHTTQFSDAELIQLKNLIHYWNCLLTLKKKTPVKSIWRRLDGEVNLPVLIWNASMTKYINAKGVISVQTVNVYTVFVLEPSLKIRRFHYKSGLLQSISLHLIKKECHRHN